MTSTQSFNEKLKELMTLHDPPLDTKELAAKLDISYEHARRLYRGHIIPPRHLVETIAKAFNSDASELEAMARQDAFYRKFGPNAQPPVFNPELAPFVNSWPVLSENERVGLLKLLKTYLAAKAKKVRSV